MLLRKALAEKSRACGRRYTYRNLHEDSGVDFSYPSKVMRGKNRPSEAIIEAWAQALHPYLPLDAALVEAGYLPKTKSLRHHIEQIVMGVHLNERGADDHADTEDRDIPDEQPPRDDPGLR